MTDPGPFGLPGLAARGLPDDDVRAASIASRIARGRPLRLALRVLVVVVASWLAVAAAGWQPASAVIAGALTWLLRTGRADLA